MSTIIPVQDNLSIGSLNNLCTVVTWTGLVNGDDGKPIGASGWADRSAQVVGVFGTGGTCVIEGSNNGVDYETLNDPFGVPVSITAAGVKAITEVTQFIRPRVTGGDGSTLLDITMLVRRATI